MRCWDRTYLKPEHAETERTGAERIGTGRKGRARLTVDIGYIEQVRLAGIGTYLLPYYPRLVNHRQFCLLIPYMQSQNVPSLVRANLTHSVRDIVYP